MSIGIRSKRAVALFACGCVLFSAVFIVRARGSDHADTPAIAAAPGTDLTDVFVFPSPTNANNVVLVMNAHPLITPANTASTVFDPNVLYQFKIDNNGDFREDLVIQAKFSGTTPATQTAKISGPVLPSRIGNTAIQETPNATAVPFNVTAGTTLTNGAKVFCGPREDPFFFDLEQFYTILPDRASPVFTPTFTNTSGVAVSTSPANPNQPQAATWRSPANARDYLSGFNVLSIVIELPKTMLTGGGTSKIGVWCTTSK
jgi:hypothetical protein